MRPPVTHSLFPLPDENPPHCRWCHAEMPNYDWDICESCIERANAGQVGPPRTAEGHRKSRPRNQENYPW